MKLRAGLHPVSLRRLPEAVWMDGTPVAGNGTYSRLTGKGETGTPDGFVPYVPEDRSKSTSETSGHCAAHKRAVLFARVRTRDRARLRRLRHQHSNMEAAELYRDFVGPVNVDATKVMHDNENGESDEESRLFWEALSFSQFVGRSIPPLCSCTARIC